MANNASAGKEVIEGSLLLVGTIYPCVQLSLFVNRGFDWSAASGEHDLTHYI